MARRKKDIVSEAAEQWPFVNIYDPAVTRSPARPEGYVLETWPKGETGGSDYPRPRELPMERVGIELYGDRASPLDVAADLLHVDPFANYTREELLSNLSPEQIATLKYGSLDYASSLDQGEQRAMQNAIDSAMRGYVFHQWPASANAEMRYDPRQMALLDLLQKYTQTGVYPLDFDLARMK